MTHFHVGDKVKLVKGEKIVISRDYKEMYEVLNGVAKSMMRNGKTRKQACNEIRKTLGLKMTQQERRKG